MSRTFYVDSRTGSDSGNGSAAAPWASLGKVNSTGLQAGDTVLFARGATFNGILNVDESGAAGAPITFGAYGTGEAPVITGGGNGVQGNGHDHIVVRDIHISGVSGAGIQSRGSADWTIDNVDVDDAGRNFVNGNMEFAAFQFWNAEDLTIANSSYKDINGDGAFIWNANDVKILNNHFEVVQGANSDNLHMYNVWGYEVRGNYMSMEGDTNSGKGTFHSQEGGNGVVADNVFRGGNYGVGNTDDNLTIEHNEFFNQNHAKWSGAIIISETFDVANNVITDNIIHNANIGIYSYQDHARDNFTITNNIFDGVVRAALLNEGRLSGTFANNTIVGEGSEPVEFTGWVPKGQSWSEHGNTVTATAPAMDSITPGGAVTADEVFPSTPPAPAPAPAPAPVAVAPPPVVAPVYDSIVRLMTEAERNASSAAMA